MQIQQDLNCKNKNQPSSNEFIEWFFNALQKARAHIKAHLDWNNTIGEQNVSKQKFKLMIWDKFSQEDKVKNIF